MKFDPGVNPGSTRAQYLALWLGIGRVVGTMPEPELPPAAELERLRARVSELPSAVQSMRLIRILLDHIEELQAEIDRLEPGGTIDIDQPLA